MTEFEEFGSRVIYVMEGWIHEEMNTDRFTRATEAEVTTEANLKFDEMLYANIINLDSWLHDHWAERMASEIDLDDDRTFTPDWNEVTVRLDLRSDEVVKAAEQRANEDATKAAYVLGNWVHLAEKRDHIPSYGALRIAFKQVSERDDQPDDATTEEYRGGEK